MVLTELASLMEGKWSCENGHVTELTSLMEGEWSCFKRPV